MAQSDNHLNAHTHRFTLFIISSPTVYILSRMTNARFVFRNCPWLKYYKHAP